MDVRLLNPADTALHLEALTDVLLDAVEDGASVGFLWPLPRAEAQAFWREVLASAGRGERYLWGAWLEGRLVGTVQLVPAQKANQRHRADVSKLLVHRTARRRGVGRALMQALEAKALALERTLLTLDTREGDASEPLYQSLGYVRFGVIPGYARGSHGALEACAFYYKELGRAG
jgi:acetyltransferase